MRLRQKTFSFAKALLLLTSISCGAFSWAGYRTTVEQCNGLPQLPIPSVAGTCLGLLAGPEVGFIKPRKALQVPGENQLLVTDMGGWSDNRGILWLLDFSTERGLLGPFSARKLATGLSLPHDIKLGPDGRVYLGEADRIQRFSLRDQSMAEVETVVADLPYTPDAYQHPLTNFVFLQNNDLLVNVGSKTDACGKAPGECDEAQFVGLRLYSYQQESGRWDPEYKLYATGLRNSMALAVHSSGMILQAENSTDLPSASEPYEEINIIQEDGFYGWPYCLNRAFDRGKIPNGCEQPRYVAPYSLMPPHVAPLDMIYYDSDVMPVLSNTLVLSWHGYRVVGHRLVSYEVDARGLPLLAEQVTYAQDPIPPGTTFTSHTVQPLGGTKADAQHQEVIYRWNEVSGLRPEGAPVGLLQLDDGTLLIVEDKNKSLLRLAPGQPYSDPYQTTSLTPIEGFHFEGAVVEVLEKRCASCHTELVSDPGRVLNKRQWIGATGNITRLESRLTQHPRQMPPGQPLAADEVEIILNALE